MVIIKYKKGSEYWYKPELEQDPVFMHCSDGYMEVREQYFDKNTFPLLLFHGQKVEIKTD